MAPKLLNDGYQPIPRPNRDGVIDQRRFLPASTGNVPPPPPPPNTGSSVVKPRE